MTHCSNQDCRRARPDWLVRLARLGLRVDGAWFCSSRCVRVSSAARLKRIDAAWAPSGRLPRPRLGAILLQQESVTARHLAAALEMQKCTGLRLGAQLEALGYASREQILRALAAQSGVSYLTTVDVAAAEKVRELLTAVEVQTLGIVPLRIEGQRLLVACAAPAPVAAIGALQVLAARTIEPFIVADTDYAKLIRAFGRQQLPAFGLGLDANVVSDIDDGAEQIAAFAKEAGAVSVTEAQLDRFTWVRLAANGRAKTLLVPHTRREVEELDLWLAATTRH